MADDSKTPATPAGNPATDIDVAAITRTAIEAATRAATAAVTAAVGPLTEQVKTLQEGLGKAPTTESVGKAVTDALAAQTASQTKATDRVRFISEKLKDVPDAYHSMIGDDPTKFDEQARKLRAVLKGDLEKLGVKAANVGGDTASTGSGNPAPATRALDTSKLSGIELIQQGVQQTSAPGSPAPGSAK